MHISGRGFLHMHTLVHMHNHDRGHTHRGKERGREHTHTHTHTHTRTHARTHAHTHCPIDLLSYHNLYLINSSPAMVRIRGIIKAKFSIFMLALGNSDPVSCLNSSTVRWTTILIANSIEIESILRIDMGIQKIVMSTSCSK